MRQGLKKSNIIFLAALSLAVLALYLAGWILLDKERVVALLQQVAENGAPLFFAVALLAASLSVPRQFIALASGLAFGWLPGLCLCSLATLGGNAAQFGAARFLLRPALQKRFADKIAWLDQISSLGPFKMTLMLRLLPAGHSGIINLAAGSSSIRPAPFLGGSYLGQLPQNAIFALIGSGLAVNTTWRFALAALLFACSLLLAAILYKRYRHIIPQAGKP